MSDTSEKLLVVAEALFSERGFYGVSIAAIASELGITKQALLHHFNSKEKLYGAVLARISNDFENAQQQVTVAEAEPIPRIKAFVTRLADPSPSNVRRTRLLMRELLDNNVRAKQAEHWYLKHFLDQFVAMVQVVPGREAISATDNLGLIYQWLGAINYFLVSIPTLTAILGEEAFEDMARGQRTYLNRLVDATLIQAQL